MNTERFSVIPGHWVIVRLGPEDPIPPWALSATGFVSITRTPAELSIVCPTGLPPEGVQAEAGWSLIKLHGPFPFSHVGVLASFVSPLAAAGISLFAISTFDTDYLLVKRTSAASACEALVRAGHTFVVEA